jgi:hypothetical protein
MSLEDSSPLHHGSTSDAQNFKEISLKGECQLNAKKMIMRKPKKNITAYAFFIKEVRFYYKISCLTTNLEEARVLRQ